MTHPSTQMRREIEEIPHAVDRLLTHGSGEVFRLAADIREFNPSLLVSVARGSSDHACTYLKYAGELLLRLPMASLGPSVKSIYGVEVQAKGALGFAISQSGQSPDIVEMTHSITRSGALTVAITNNLNSPLADVASAAMPIHAGPELSVAATKTFVTSLVSGLWLLAELKQDRSLLDSISDLPEQLEKAIHCDWTDLADAITGRSVFTLGRGPSWAVSNEAALKFKETCQIHAESYSSAEVLHGPVSIVDDAFPIIVFAAADAAEEASAQVADTLSNKGARVFATTNNVSNATTLPHIRTKHWMTDPIAIITSFYALVETIASRRGIDPDTPRHLKKVTETV